MKLTGIHQIEITSMCNLRCPYCVHPKMGRPKIHMTDDVFDQTLYWVRRFCQEGTQGIELNLCGIGESTLHPKFNDWVRWARQAIGERRRLILATNGVGVTEEHAEAMAAARMDVWVSLHRPEKAGPTVNLLKRYEVLRGVSADPSIAAVNWAGQVNWEVTAPRGPCPWLKDGWGFVLADARVSTCCFDGEGKDGIIGTIWDDLMTLQVVPYSLCAQCHHTIPNQES